MATTLLLLEDTLHSTSSGCLQGLESHCNAWESAAVDFSLALSWPTHTSCRYWSSSAEVVHVNLSDICRAESSKVDATCDTWTEALILLFHTHHPWKLLTFLILFFVSCQRSFGVVSRIDQSQMRSSLLGWSTSLETVLTPVFLRSWLLCPWTGELAGFVGTYPAVSAVRSYLRSPQSVLLRSRGFGFAKTSHSAVRPGR